MPSKSGGRALIRFHLFVWSLLDYIDPKSTIWLWTVGYAKHTCVENGTLESALCGTIFFFSVLFFVFRDHVGTGLWWTHQKNQLDQLCYLMTLFRYQLFFVFRLFISWPGRSFASYLLLVNKTIFLYSFWPRACSCAFPNRNENVLCECVYIQWVWSWHILVDETGCTKNIDMREWVSECLETFVRFLFYFVVISLPIQTACERRKTTHGMASMPQKYFRNQHKSLAWAHTFLSCLRWAVWGAWHWTQWRRLTNNGEKFY